MAAGSACSDFVTEIKLVISCSGVCENLRRRRKIGAMELGQTRHHLEAEVTVRAENGSVPGRAIDMSASGMAVILPVELPIGTTVELEIRLPTIPVTTRAI